MNATKYDESSKYCMVMLLIEMYMAAKWDLIGRVEKWRPLTECCGWAVVQK